MFVEVAYPLPLNRTFHYRLPAELAEQQKLVGRRVLAPFGKQNRIGFIVGSAEEPPEFPTKSILSFVDGEPVIDDTLLDLARWLSKTYLCSLGEALAAIVPTQLVAPNRSSSPKSNVQSPISNSNASHDDLGPWTLDLGRIRLSNEQKRALERFVAAVESRSYHPFLLRGITDSGKTELYLRTIDRIMESGRQALFLVPEIALTPPFIERLIARYQNQRVGLWHSGLSMGERYQTWKGVQKGDIHVLLGARSAVFAPFRDLGVVILDEEHEPSYKQEDRPRYHAREVALRRAERAKAVIIMGSATPSLESYWNAKRGYYTLVELRSRVESRQLPPVTLIDRSQHIPSKEPLTPTLSPGERELPKDSLAPWGRGEGEGASHKGGRSSFEVFSELLKLALEQRLARREQVMLYVNRRGFTPFLRCSFCGWVAHCTRCSMTLASHLKEEGSYLQCHACLARQEVPKKCPTCGGKRLGQFGVGTQRVEQEVKRLFPFAKIARLDRDIARPRRAYQKVYQAFAGRALDVLVGTQMIAKGFDFPGVTLVGVIDADVSLHLPDFRAAERTFQLTTQVAGRTGRGEYGGDVLVQTHFPKHYALQAAQRHDYLRFYEEELRHREALHYPPFCRLVRLLIRDRKESVAQKAADDLAEKLHGIAPSSRLKAQGVQLEPAAKSLELSSVQILGPVPAPYSRLRGQYRYSILLKGDTDALKPYLEFLRDQRLPRAFLVVDVDPVDLL